ncbi:YceI family protein [Paucihalobacter sp.]|uniref:YceI family protein n=1 Tax=Paucihalobacter sp. TaxID=2850405 RepID=UPI002FE0763E
MTSYKTINGLKVLLITVLFSFSFLAIGQNFTLNQSDSSLKIFGTSNVHDWEMNADEQKGSISFKDATNAEISKLEIIVTAEALKSGKNGMDKNTYKALNTKTHKQIKYVYGSTTSKEKVSENQYKLTTQGQLTINGVTKPITLSFNMTTNNNVITLKGEKKIIMTDYNVEPPTALLGTIKTGDEVNIVFETKLK